MLLLCSMAGQNLTPPHIFEAVVTRQPTHTAAKKPPLGECPSWSRGQEVSQHVAGIENHKSTKNKIERKFDNHSIPNKRFVARFGCACIYVPSFDRALVLASSPSTNKQWRRSRLL
jgi:hypothetical protein